MTTLNIKIVGVEDDSVLVKYATDASAKSIDEYDAVAYQPKLMGYTNVNDFLNGIKPGALAAATQRDNLEKVANIAVDLASWIGATSEYTVYFPVAPPDATQINPVLDNPEVIL
jgi:hypothetical protein